MNEQDDTESVRDLIEAINDGPDSNGVVIIPEFDTRWAAVERLSRLSAWPQILFATRTLAFCSKIGVTLISDQGAV